MINNCSDCILIFHISCSVSFVAVYSQKLNPFCIAVYYSYVKLNVCWCHVLVLRSPSLSTWALLEALFKGKWQTDRHKGTLQVLPSAIIFSFVSYASPFLQARLVSCLWKVRAPGPHSSQAACNQPQSAALLSDDFAHDHHGGLFCLP